MEDRQMITHVAAHSPTIPSLYLRHSLFSNPSAASPTSQLILHSFFRFSYVTGSSLTSPGEPPMFQSFPTVYPTMNVILLWWFLVKYATKFTHYTSHIFKFCQPQNTLHFFFNYFIFLHFTVLLFTSVLQNYRLKNFESFIFI